MPIKIYYSGQCVAYDTPTQKEQSTPPPRTAKRKYSIKPKNRRQIISSALYGYERKKWNVCFFTLTYRVDEFHDNPFDHNEHIRYFMDYLNEKGCIGSGYIWTKELTENKVPHYHVLIDLKFTSAKILNKYWCNARKQTFAANALQTDKKFGFIIKHKFGAAAYAAKYCTKGEKTKDGKTIYYQFNSRAYTISNGWNAPTTTINDSKQSEIVHSNIVNLNNSTQNQVIKTDFCEIFRIDQNLAKQIIETVDV